MNPNSQTAALATTYNYEPLSRSVSLNDLLKEASNQYFANKSFKYGAIFLAVMIVSGMFIFGVASGEPLTGLMIGLVILAVMTVIMVVTVSPWVKLRRFADANSGIELLTADAATNYAGMIFNHGHSRTIKGGIRSTGDNFFELANYQYTVGSGKHARNYNYGYIRIKLPRRLPHMLLDAKGNNFMGRFSNLPSSFRKDQVVSLEGDFDKYFTLYAPNGYDTDVRYVFTPDIMQLVIDTAASYDVEVIDDNLYLYSKDNLKLTSPTDMEQLVALTNRLNDKFYHRTDYYADHRTENARESNLIANTGQRLKPRSALVWVLLVVLCVVAYIMMSI